MEDNFIKDLFQGLTSPHKRIPSMYLYDERGSLLFQEIMEQPEYYLTKAEFNIFRKEAEDIVIHFPHSKNSALQILELGAGDGRKTEILLQALNDLKLPCIYEPVDIDPCVLQQLVNRIQDKYEHISIQPRPGYNEEALQKVNSTNPTVILFLGSNIGNYSKAKETELLNRISKSMKPGDCLLLGADKVKDPKLIARAYNDEEGKTADFNLNLLRRINQALQIDLKEDNFTFYSYYHPKTKEIRSFLVTKDEQVIHFPHRPESVQLAPWTYIQTETSRKYTLQDLNEMGFSADLHLMHEWQDSNQYFYELLYSKK